MDNGIVLQELVIHWLGRYRRPKGKRSAGRDTSMFGTLKQHRQAHVVWWEARMVRHRARRAAVVRPCGRCTLGTRTTAPCWPASA